jgi:hypothetical protein
MDYDAPGKAIGYEACYQDWLRILAEVLSFPPERCRFIHIVLQIVYAGAEPTTPFGIYMARSVVDGLWSHAQGKMISGNIGYRRRSDRVGRRVVGCESDWAAMAKETKWNE